MMQPTRFQHRKFLNSFLGCNSYYPWEALVIGMIGGLSYLSVHFAVLKLGLDDPLDAVAVHAGGGNAYKVWPIV